MVKQIEVRGVIISNESQEAYDYYEIPAISPKKLFSQFPENNTDDVEIILSSGGGSVSAGQEIYEFLNAYKGKITTKIVGLAGSIASVFPLTSDEVLISRIGQFMIHNASVGGEVHGDYKEFDRVSAMLKSTNEALANAYVAKTGKPKEEILALMDKETWFTSEQAIEFGLADGIIEGQFKQSSNYTSGVVASNYVQNVLTDKMINSYFEMKKQNEIKFEADKLSAQLKLLKLKGDY